MSCPDEDITSVRYRVNNLISKTNTSVPYGATSGTSAYFTALNTMTFNVSTVFPSKSGYDGYIDTAFPNLSLANKTILKSYVGATINSSFIYPKNGVLLDYYKNKGSASSTIATGALAVPTPILPIILDNIPSFKILTAPQTAVSDTIGAPAKITTLLNGTSTVTPISKEKVELYSAQLELYVTLLNIEYCVYYSAYKVAIDSYLSDILYNNKTPAPTTLLNLGGDSRVSQNLNNSVTIMLNLLKFVLDTLNTNSETVIANSSDLTNKIAKNIDAITNQNTILQKHMSSSDVYKSMVEYSFEKNRYSSNLLALYGGLNIVAIALLVYIYRS